MRYVAQQDMRGCLVAAVAMVLDMTYEDVGLVVPLQDSSRLYELGYVEAWWQNALEQIRALASARGKIVVSLPPTVRPGLRYLAQVRAALPNSYHALAVDETGIAFDPDPCNEDVRKPLSEYDVLALLEFRHVEN
jgi:hypothetical protein